ncbi:MAG: hypothetical protein M1814_001292 [Vezdaea aestivalis]|nr:MAG: hypothetical protein M1814_001292 [Vezdaea aestivalis]
MRRTSRKSDDGKNSTVFLLKTKAPDKDGYEDWFSRNGVVPGSSCATYFVPVLGHSSIPNALQKLRDMFEDPDTYFRQASEVGQWVAIAFTSQRAVEAYRGVVTGRRLCGTHVELDAEYLQPDMNYFVVGEATKAVLAATRAVDARRICGSECGTSAELALQVQASHNAMYGNQPKGQKPGILFITGAKHRDDLKRILDTESQGEDHIKLEELVIYETKEVASFAPDLSLALRNARSSDAFMNWFVVFSPNGCESLLRELGLLDETTGRARTGFKIGTRSAFLATIGPTTRDFLVNKFDCEPDVVATKPTPEGVGESIKAFTVEYLGLRREPKLEG